ncbi:hypothetical protein [Clostridium sp. DL-VIII]|uniref:hypothetical protein n=1 Tax=Clostridium sp. DL-VIII TaxID=641107 RepID=UPI0002D65CC1|nr:hypothetical protein [Clostridium sp. DL-VIII]
MVIEQDLAVNETQGIFTDILKTIGTMINKVEEIKLSIIDINKKKQSIILEIKNISSLIL